MADRVTHPREQLLVDGFVVVTNDSYDSAHKIYM
jgi:hypothetical protein